ncbi:MAG: 30S ribosomal protein S9 [Bacilli bacterium]|jgi:small subunit ribosomal protein S9|nr:30S ribosomal protein S9 [Bacilli bacterium]
MAKKVTPSVYYGTGKRKSAIARVYITPGEGKVIVNGKDAKAYFPYDTNVIVLDQPFAVTDNVNKYDVKAFVKGGGFSAQSEAVRLGISRALMEVTEEYRKPLKVAGLVTRDSRIKERKKYGLKGARRAPQFSKR